MKTLRARTELLWAQTPTLSIVLAMLLFVVAAIVPSRGQDPRRRRTPGDGGDTPAKSATNEAEKTPAKDDAKVLAIVGGDIYTVSHEVIRRGTVLIKGTKIAEVGQDVTVPKGATVIDARGKYVTPGFISLSMSGIGLSSTGDRNARNADALDPFDQNIKLALGVGITCGSVELGGSGFSQRGRRAEDCFLGFEPDIPFESLLFDDGELHLHLEDCSDEGCICCGMAVLPREPIGPSPSPAAPTPSRYAVIKMSYGRLEPMLIEKPTFYSPGRGALSGALNRHNWRQSIAQTRKFLTDLVAYERAVRSGQRPAPPRKPVSDELISLVRKESALRISANSVDEIRDMIALAEELDYRLILDGVIESWLIANELSEADVPVVVTPRQRRRARIGHEASSGSSIETTGVLQRSGVQFAVVPLGDSISLDGLPGRDLTSLPLEAAFAVRGGCDEATALAAITIVPAKLLGLADRIGSIDPGKDADLLVLDGPPLDYRTYVETAIVSGNVSYERDKDRIYPVFKR